jgi:hypothetical protein
MGNWEKLLEGMRQNPRGDWKIDNIETICSALDHLGVSCKPPRRGSHYTVRCISCADILTIPKHNPIKPVYVKKFISMIDSIINEGKEDSVEGGGESSTEVNVSEERGSQ